MFQFTSTKKFKLTFEAANWQNIELHSFVYEKSRATFKKLFNQNDENGSHHYS